jgi:homoserine O-acetyltransferase
LPKQIRFENIALQSGTMLPYANLVYKTYGKLNSTGDNCIVIETGLSGNHTTFAKMIGRARALDPGKYFIVVPNALCNGISTSPSNMEAPFHGNRFPAVTIEDNVALQHQLLTEVLNVNQIKLIYGFSMGARQACTWAATHPAMVQRLMAVCGVAKSWPMNDVILRSAIAALMADSNFRNGNYNLAPRAGLRAIARVFIGWTYSATFFRDGFYRSLGFESIDALSADLENYYLEKDANDILAMLSTYKTSSLELPNLKNITAKTIYMPCDHDMFIPMEDARLEATQIANAEFRPILSLYGHAAGAPGFISNETMFVEQAMRELLAR